MNIKQTLPIFRLTCYSRGPNVCGLSVSIQWLSIVELGRKSARPLMISFDGFNDGLSIPRSVYRARYQFGGKDAYEHVCIYTMTKIREIWGHVNNRERALCGNCVVNSLWRSDTQWRHRYGSTLAQAIVCCLKVPMHHLNQCLFHICMVEITEISLRDKRVKVKMEIGTVILQGNIPNNSN